MIVMTPRHTLLLFAGIFLPLWVLAGGARLPEPGEGEFNARDLRKTLEAHHPAQQDELRRSDVWAEKRLTPAELAQLREQVRQQWQSRIAVSAPVESHPAGRSVSAPAPGPVTPLRTRPARSQRP